MNMITNATETQTRKPTTQPTITPPTLDELLLVPVSAPLGTLGVVVTALSGISGDDDIITGVASIAEVCVVMISDDAVEMVGLSVVTEDDIIVDCLSIAFDRDIANDVYIILEAVTIDDAELLLAITAKLEVGTRLTTVVDNTRSLVVSVVTAIVSTIVEDGNDTIAVPTMTRNFHYFVSATG